MLGEMRLDASLQLVGSSGGPVACLVANSPTASDGPMLTMVLVPGRTGRSIAHYCQPKEGIPWPLHQIAGDSRTLPPILISRSLV